MLKSSRFFLEPLKHSDSYIRVEVDKEGYVNIKFSDCDRRVLYYFGVPGDERAKRKIARLKGAIDAVYDHLHSK